MAGLVSENKKKLVRWTEEEKMEVDKFCAEKNKTLQNLNKTETKDLAKKLEIEVIRLTTYRDNKKRKLDENMKKEMQKKKKLKQMIHLDWTNQDLPAPWEVAMYNGEPIFRKKGDDSAPSNLMTALADMAEAGELKETLTQIKEKYEHQTKKEIKKDERNKHTDDPEQSEHKPTNTGIAPIGKEEKAKEVKDDKAHNEEQIQLLNVEVKKGNVKLEKLQLKNNEKETEIKKNKKEIEQLKQEMETQRNLHIKEMTDKEKKHKEDENKLKEKIDENKIQMQQKDKDLNDMKKKINALKKLIEMPAADIAE